MKFSPKLIVGFIALSWLSILPGQVLRFEFGSAGIVASDFVALAALCVGTYLIAARKWLRTDPAVRLLGLWACASVVSWVLASFSYGWSDRASAFAYAVRLVAYLSVFVVGIAAGKRAEHPYLRYGVAAVVGLFVLGAIVLAYLPDFAPLAASGWDPHMGRFTSTWLDPNYFGSFLGIAFAVALCWEAALFQREDKRSWVALQIFLVLCAFGVYLAVSRSALVTLVFAAAVAAARTSWRAAIIGIVAIACVVAVPGRLQSRIGNSISYVSDGSSTDGGQAGGGSADPTAGARVESWKKAWQLARSAPVFGVGYNYYEQAQIRQGLLDESGETRGTAGSDSSLLTLLATTGFVGIFACLAFFGFLAFVFLRSRDVWNSASLAALAGVAIGSQFNNLLLYPFVLLPLMLLLGITYSRRVE